MIGSGNIGGNRYSNAGDLISDANALIPSNFCADARFPFAPADSNAECNKLIR